MSTDHDRCGPIPLDQAAGSGDASRVRTYLSLRAVCGTALGTLVALAAASCGSGTTTLPKIDAGTTDASSDVGSDAPPSDGGGPDTGGGDASVAGHLVISEIGVAPAAGEFIEIYNAGSAAVDLGSYFLSDNATYFQIAAGTPWNPPLATPGTDFLAQFPVGATLAPGAAISIATSPTFEAQFSKCPDYILSTTPLTCTNGVAKAMLAPTNGGIGASVGLSNDREMVVLFQWTGGPTVKDVDYVTWGTVFDAETRADKTAASGYQPDTAPASQKAAIPPGVLQSIERCSAIETGEKTSGGNGLLGHDETSEALDQTFKVQTTPTPGAKNGCL